MSSTEISFTNRTTGGGRRRNAGLRTAALARASILVRPSPLVLAQTTERCTFLGLVRSSSSGGQTGLHVMRPRASIRRPSATHDARLRAGHGRDGPLGVHKRRRSALPLAHSSKLRVVSPSDSEYGRIGGMGKGRSGDKGQGTGTGSRRTGARGAHGRATAYAWRTAGRETGGHDEPGESVARPTAATSPEGARSDHAGPNKKEPGTSPRLLKTSNGGICGARTRDLRRDRPAL